MEIGWLLLHEKMNYNNKHKLKSITSGKEGTKKENNKKDKEWRKENLIMRNRQIAIRKRSYDSEKYIKGKEKWHSTIHRSASFLLEINYGAGIALWTKIWVFQGPKTFESWSEPVVTLIAHLEQWHHMGRHTPSHHTEHSDENPRCLFRKACLCEGTG